MPCYRPLVADYSGVNTVSGKRKIVFRSDGELLLPCGKCVGCLLERSRQWAVRCTHEAQFYKDYFKMESSFVTLTYNNENVGRSLDRRDCVRFMKYLRKEFSDRKIKFYMCGEYGSKNWRPHFHYCIFGVDFSEDRYIWKSSSNGDIYYRSPTLERIWTKGFSVIGALNFQTVAYTARYILKKYRGTKRKSEQWYDGRVPEFTGMSLKSAIGREYCEKFLYDIYGEDKDHIIVNGNKCKPPRYYDKLLERTDIDLYNTIKERRIAEWKAKDQELYDRLLVRESVKLKTITQLERNLENEQ